MGRHYHPAALLSLRQTAGADDDLDYLGQFVDLGRHALQPVMASECVGRALSMLAASPTIHEFPPRGFSTVFLQAALPMIEGLVACG